MRIRGHRLVVKALRDYTHSVIHLKLIGTCLITTLGLFVIPHIITTAIRTSDPSAVGPVLVQLGLIILLGLMWIVLMTLIFARRMLGFSAPRAMAGAFMGCTLGLEAVRYASDSPSALILGFALILMTLGSYFDLHASRG